MDPHLLVTTAWLAEGRPTSAEIPNVPPADFLARPDPRRIRTADQVARALHTSTRLLDVRSAPEFDGTYARARRAGHIPGAVNLPRAEPAGADGRMRPPDVLRERLALAGCEAGARRLSAIQRRCPGRLCAAGTARRRLRSVRRLARLLGRRGNDEVWPVARRSGEPFLPATRIM